MFEGLRHHDNKHLNMQTLQMADGTLKIKGHTLLACAFAMNPTNDIVHPNV